MRKQFFAMAAVAAALTLGACSSEEEAQVEPARQITVSTEIGAMSRVATDAEGAQRFEEGDVISVYAWTGTDKEGNVVAPAKDSRVVDNSHNTLVGSSWVAAPQMLWKNMQEKHYFIGVYPAIGQGTGLDDDLTRYAYTLRPGDEEASDLLVAVQTDGILAGYGSVPLAFTHVMAKVSVNLTFRNQWGLDDAGNNRVPEVGSVQLLNAAGQATVDLLTKGVTPIEESRAAQTLTELAENTRYSSVVIPQDGVRQIAVVVGGKRYTYTHGSDISLAGGKVTTINLTIGRDVVSPGDVTVDPWDDSADPIDGEATDPDGNADGI